MKQEKIEKPKKVSVVIASYNGSRYIQSQILSILEQSYKPYEIIVTDDASTDQTINVLKNITSEIPIVLISSDKNRGFVKNFEEGISAAKGDIIVLADQDDLWATNKIEMLVANIGNNMLIHSNYSLIDANGNLQKNSAKKKGAVFDDPKKFFYKNCVTGCTAAFKSELRKNILPFPERLAYHDWWIGYAAAMKGGIKYCDNDLTLYRQHETQDTGHELSVTKDASSIINLSRFEIWRTNVIGANNKQLMNLNSIANDKRAHSHDDLRRAIDLIKDVNYSLQSNRIRWLVLLRWLFQQYQHSFWWPITLLTTLVWIQFYSLKNRGGH